MRYQSLPQAEREEPQAPHGPVEATNRQRAGYLQLEPSRRLVALCGEVVRLTPSEYDLFTTLLSRPGDTFSREELAHLVWGYMHVRGSRSIDMEVSRLRAKLNIGDAAPQIVAVRRRGYRLLLDAIEAELAAGAGAADEAEEADETEVA